MFYDYVMQTTRGRVAHYAEMNRDGTLGKLPKDVKEEVAREVGSLKSLERAQLYFLQVDQADALRDLPVADGGFPHLPHPLTFVEFDGALHYDYDHVHCTVTTEDGAEPSIDNVSVPGGSNYKGVMFQENEDGVTASWLGPIILGKGHELKERISSNYLTFSVAVRRSEFPSKSYDHHQMMLNRLLTMKVRADQLEAEKEHCKRLYSATVNLIYFLTAENLTYVKIRPEHRRAHGAEMISLPKSDRPYRIVSMHARRVRYQERSVPSGAHRVTERYDVSGHFRHLASERFERDEAGNVRVIWIQAHQRGLEADVYRPKLRVGHIGARLLDYDEFRRENA